MDREFAKELESRRAFLRQAVTRAGVAFAVPVVLSTVRLGDLQAQASGAPIGEIG